MLLRFIVMFIIGMVYGAVLFLYGYNTSKKNFANELTNLIKRLPEDVQNEVLTLINKDIEKSKNI